MRYGKTIMVALLAGALAAASCSEAFERLEPVVVLLEGDIRGMEAGAALGVFGSPASVLAADGFPSATYGFTREPYVRRYDTLYRALPLQGGLRWLRGSDVSLFYAVSPASPQVDGSDGRIDGLFLPGGQEDGSLEEALSWVGDGVAEYGKPARLRMRPAFSMVTLRLAGVPGDAVIEDVAFRSPSQAVWGWYGCDLKEGRFLCGPRTEANARVKAALTREGTEAVARAALLPHPYHDLEAAVTAREGTRRLTFTVPLTHPYDALAAGGRKAVSAGYPQGMPTTQE